MVIYTKQGGPLRLVPVAGVLPTGEDAARPAPERRSSIDTFNAIWMEELKASGHPMTFPGMTWAELGECYARLAGETPVIDNGPQLDSPMPTIDRNKTASGMLIHVAIPGTGIRTLAIDLDGQGMLRRVEITEQRAYQVVKQDKPGEFKPFQQKPVPAFKPVPGSDKW